MIGQRDILLVPFPFSDQSGRKVRPVIVVSNDNYNDKSEDFLVVGVTTNPMRNRYSIDLHNNDLEQGRLISECLIKVDNLLKIDKSLVIKKIGTVKGELFQKIINIILEIIKI